MELPSKRIDAWTLGLVLAGVGFLAVPNSITERQMTLAVCCWGLAVLIFLLGFPAAQTRGHGIWTRIASLVTTPSARINANVKRTHEAPPASLHQPNSEILAELTDALSRIEGHRDFSLGLGIPPGERDVARLADWMEKNHGSVRQIDEEASSLLEECISLLWKVLGDSQEAKRRALLPSAEDDNTCRVSRVRSLANFALFLEKSGRAKSRLIRIKQ